MAPIRRLTGGQPGAAVAFSPTTCRRRSAANGTGRIAAALGGFAATGPPPQAGFLLAGGRPPVKLPRCYQGWSAGSCALQSEVRAGCAKGCRAQGEAEAEAL